MRAANTTLADDATRATVRQLHARETPLAEMCDVLGLPLSPQIRQLLDALTPDVTAGIRAATLAALDRGELAMPLDCDVSELDVDSGVATTVDITDPGESPTIRIRRA